MLQDCKHVLQSLAENLNKYVPQKSRKVGNAIRALKWIVSEGKRMDNVRKLERHTHMLELALLGLSLYAIGTYPSLIVRDVANQEAEATTSEKEASTQERDAQKGERLAAEEERVAQRSARAEATKRNNEIQIRDACMCHPHAFTNG